MKGRCVICGNLGRLTRDHVPPRGVTPLNPIEISRLLPDETERECKRPRRGFQAPTFPSLCLECNVERLGKCYDPALNEFVNAFAVWARAAFQLGMVLPERAAVDLLPSAVAHSVIGHLLAAEERSDPTVRPHSGTMGDEMREYFLGTSRAAPSFRLFVWPFAGSHITILRNFGIAKVLGRTHGVIVGDLLKFFPFAFWVVHEVPGGVTVPGAELSLSRNVRTTVVIPLRPLPSRRWPEFPSDEEVVLHSADRGLITSPYRKRAT